MTVEEMEARISELEKKVTILEDVDAVKRLHRVYSYYVMYMMRDEIVDCFADHPDVALYWLEGTWLGKEGVKRYFGVGSDRPEPAPGFVHQVMPIAGAVDIEPGGQRAKGRWYAFGGVNILREGRSNPSFVGGIYEIEYIKQDGVWKFLTVKWIINYTANLPDTSWNTPESIGKGVLNFPAPNPDIPPFADDPRFTSGYIFPFHYNHPVTGKPSSEKSRNLRTREALKAASKSSAKKK